jgi:hypothetical protein
MARVKLGDLALMAKRSDRHHADMASHYAGEDRAIAALAGMISECVQA